jgi:serine/threonine protein kinase
LAYMAPERFTTGIADVRADVYSLACMLHECLTGAQPYPGNRAEQQIAGHLTLDPPKPSSVNPAVPAAFDEVIARGMAKKPAERLKALGNRPSRSAFWMVDLGAPAATAMSRTCRGRGSFADPIPQHASAASAMSTCRGCGRSRTDGRM